MHRRSSLFFLASAIASMLIVTTVRGSVPLKVAARVPAGPYYVGQAIEVSVDVEGAPGPLSLELPQRPFVESRALPVGPASKERVRFLIIPGRSGPFDFPTIRVRSGARDGVVRLPRLTVLKIPAEGRTSTFLGGVGAFEVRSEVEPSRVSTGRSVEFRIRVSGPAAWGSDRPPDLSSWALLLPGFRLESLPTSLEGVEPAVRTFRYRLRAMKAGRSVLPPVAVSAFDPRTRRFVTRTTAGLSIESEDLPRFDVKRLDYDLPASGGGFRLVATLMGMLGLIVAGLVAWLIHRRKRKTKADDPRTLALGLAGLVGRAEGRTLDRAQVVAEALATFLHRVDGRSPGVLTPPEAFESFGRVTNDVGLARSAEALVRNCDRAIYGKAIEDAEGLAREAREFFERLSVEGKWERQGEGLREAVETAIGDSGRSGTASR